MWINTALQKIVERPLLSRVISIKDNKIQTSDGYIDVAVLKGVTVLVGDLALLIPIGDNGDFLCIGVL